MLEEHLSPDGRYVIQLACNEMRMSHWICVPLLKETATGKALFSLDNTFWSADVVRWSGDSREVSLEMRLYPGTAPGIKVTLHLSEGHAVVEREGRTQTLSFQAAEAQVKAWADR